MTWSLIPLALLLSACSLAAVRRGGQRVNMKAFKGAFERTQKSLEETHTSAAGILKNVEKSKHTLHNLQRTSLHLAARVNAAVDSSRAQCHPLWHRYESTCYGLYTAKPAPWASAQRVCEMANSTLALAGNPGEDIFIRGLLVASMNKACEAGIWVGASDARKQTSWVSHANTAITFVHWAPGEPSNKPHEDCMFLSPKFIFRSFDDECKKEKAFLCQSRIP